MKFGTRPLTSFRLQRYNEKLISQYFWRIFLISALWDVGNTNNKGAATAKISPSAYNMPHIPRRSHDEGAFLPKALGAS